MPSDRLDTKIGKQEQMLAVAWDGDSARLMFKAYIQKNMGVGAEG